ncbi:uncharacterized protein LOC125426174 isoform X2 [Sphaerodactylus townsendi]|uniref:uncharacterized protein LOC125426174 isoform X2 n=1 Tax=Sphaerodactylus townsendi TaxID=933632 RepID=UPI00202732F0|nr:uncharacterized protein LOC125426174 isoform X2 [Sphaerodactylus townsendi]
MATAVRMAAMAVLPIAGSQTLQRAPLDSAEEERTGDCEGEEPSWPGSVFPASLETHFSAGRLARGEERERGHHQPCTWQPSR